MTAKYLYKCDWFSSGCGDEIVAESPEAAARIWAERRAARNHWPRGCEPSETKCCVNPVLSADYSGPIGRVTIGRTIVIKLTTRRINPASPAERQAVREYYGERGDGFDKDAKIWDLILARRDVTTPNVEATADRELKEAVAELADA